MKFQRLSYYFTSASLLLFVVFGYQNCSQTHFTSDLEGAVLKAEALPDGDRAQGDDGQIIPGDSPEPSPIETPVVDDKKDPKGSDEPKGSDVPKNSDMPKDSTDSDVPKQPGKKDKESSDQSDLVECQMLHPNKKIVLSYELFVQHGNSSSVRTCMSTNACLKLINAFAVQHSCSLDASAPMAQADAQRQCTEIFPGSKGTCHNATVLTDDQVNELLKKLAESK